MPIYKSQNTLLEDIDFYWTLDGLNDYSGNKNHLIAEEISGTVGTYVPPVLVEEGKINQCYLFEHSTKSYLATINNIGWIGNSTRSVSCWFKATETPTDAPFLFSCGPNVLNQAWYIQWNTVSKRILLGDWQVVLDTGFVVELDEWYHLVVTYEGFSNDIKVYFNGKLEYEGNRSFNTVDSRLTIGAKHNASGIRTWSGLIDEFGVWNNRILSQDDVNQLYDNDVGRTYSRFSYIPKYLRERETNTPIRAGWGLMKDLVSYWDFEGNANDVHGTNNGTVNGATLATGKLGQCYSFDRINDHIELMNVDLTQILSFSFWFKRGDLEEGAVFSQWSGVSNQSRFALYFNSTNHLQFYANSAWNTIATIDNTTNWYHVIITHEGGEWNVYIDNELVYTVTENKTSDVYDIHLGVFYSNLGYENYWKGLIDELGYWNKVLSENDRKLLHNKNSSIKYNKFRY